MASRSERSQESDERQDDEQAGPNRDVSEELEAIKEDLNRLRGDLADFAGALLDAGKGRAGEAKGRVASEAEQRLEDLRDALRAAKDRGGDTFDRVQQHVEERPLTSLLLAFMGGLIFGKFMDRG